MLTVKTPDETRALIDDKFGRLRMAEETIALSDALNRVLSRTIVAAEDIPGFDRSTVDGFAVRAADTFGCSESIPAILDLQGEILMGQTSPHDLLAEKCMAIATGGALPPGADAAVMLEYTEDYQDGTIGIMRPVAPGANLIFRGDDVSSGQVIMKAGKKLRPHDIGALAALGYETVYVAKQPRVGIISTGNELVGIGAQPQIGQIRDVNSWLLSAGAVAAGAEPVAYGIIPDKENALLAGLSQAAAACDLVLISGGSSVGARDITQQTIEALGQVLLHGIAVKPGKPTIIGSVGDTPVFGLPGHPVAAHFIFECFVLPLIQSMLGASWRQHAIAATLTEAISSNHGREEYMPVCLIQGEAGLQAAPVYAKSGLITKLRDTDGYIRIPRDCEGLAGGATVQVVMNSTD
ncbi:MAG: molybdopterin molybdenumtransferase MoeA [Clostridia bacterium]|nr:molybdopterin molybdenumtransferase MoeA [Clostridia bacterium]